MAGQNKNGQGGAWAAFLKEIRLMRAEGLPLDKIGERLGVSKATVHNWLEGKRAGRGKSFDQMKEYLLALGLNPSDYYDTGEQDFIQVPMVEAVGSMGGGSLESSRKVKSYLSFQSVWANSKGNPAKMVVVRAYGSSMEPTIPDGAIVLLDEAQAQRPVNDKIYYIRYGDELFIKRLKVDKSGRAVCFISDADGRETPLDSPDEFAVLGRVLWWAKEV